MLEYGTESGKYITQALDDVLSSRHLRHFVREILSGKRSILELLVELLHVGDILRSEALSFKLFGGHLRHAVGRFRYGFLKNIGGNPTVFQRLLEASVLLDNIVNGDSVALRRLFDDVLEAIDIGDAFVDQLTPPRAKAFLQQLVSRVGHVVDYVRQHVGNRSPQLLGFFEVAKDRLPCLGPSGSERFPQRIDELRERLHLGGGIPSGLSHVGDGFGLFLGVSLTDQILDGVVVLLGRIDSEGELVQGLGQNLSGEPALLKRVSE